MNHKGSIQLLLAAMLILVTLFGMGTWGVLRLWRSSVSTQFKLDHCVASGVYEYKDTMISIQQLNIAILATRASIVASAVAPEAIPALRAALSAFANSQNLLLLRWSARQARWILGRSCALRVLALPIPSMKWRRLPSDPIGPQPLHWEGNLPEAFHFEVNHGNRASAALARLNTPSDIELQWTIPKSKLLLRASNH